MIKRYITFIAASLIAFFVINCKEPFEIENNDFESALVVESTITNELKYHEVKLSETNYLDAEGEIVVNNAQVWIEDSNSNTYNFTYDTDGKYISNDEFNAVANTTYTLHINNNGKLYKSSETVLSPEAELSDVYAQLSTLNDESGIYVFVDVDNPTGNSQFFRYEFEETYKIVAPNPSTLDFTLTDSYPGEYEIETFPRTDEIETCFSTKVSSGIIQASTEGLNNNTISLFPVHFIASDDYKIRDRYSIIVKQYAQSLESYSYYKILKELGDSQSLLSQNQSGYISGNISSENNSNEKVLGFFDVASVSSKRIFFNYQDFNLAKPQYLVECESIELDYNDNASEIFDGDRNERTYLKYLLSTGYVILFSENTIYQIIGPYCGDCTSFSSNVVPEFWVE